MTTPFNDITLYLETAYPPHSPEYWEEISLQNYISDLYIRKMHGYKPPNVTRVSMDAFNYKVWNRPWKDGSLVLVAPKFEYDLFLSLDRPGKYQYMLDLIQEGMIQLCEAYNWDRSVLEQAYQEVMDCNFVFKIDYPAKQSKDKKKTAQLSVEKTETITSVFATVTMDGQTKRIKLFDKANKWIYDEIYKWASHAKWFDADRFGIGYKEAAMELWYSVSDDQVTLLLNGQVTDILDYAGFKGRLF